MSNYTEYFGMENKINVHNINESKMLVAEHFCIVVTPLKENFLMMLGRYKTWQNFKPLKIRTTSV